MKGRRNDRRGKPDYQIKIARERIETLAREAENASRKDPRMGRRYYSLVKKIGMRYNVKIPSSIKRKFCKECFSYMGAGWRLKSGRLQAVCQTCGRVARYPFKPKRQK